MFGGALAFGLLGIFLGPTLLGVGAALLRKWNTDESDALGRSHGDAGVWPAQTLKPTSGDSARF